MPFQKKVQTDSVKDETQVLVPTGDEIVPKAPESPEPKVKSKDEFAKDISPVDLDDSDFSNIHGWNLTELEFTDISLTQAPPPPKCVKEYCEKRDLVWRWLSYPAVKQSGMRGYVALSMTPELRKKVKAGDCPPTVDIDVSNKLTWREDAFLGVQPRKLYDLRRAAIAKRNAAQADVVKGQGSALNELAGRVGGAKIVEYKVKETSRQGL